MTLSEFALREHSYKRQQQWEWARSRLVAYYSALAFNINPKSLPKRPSDIMELPFVDGDVQQGGLSDSQMEAMKAAQERYEQELKLKDLE